ncbi:hypothetical protein KKC97_03915, partial [bacterium]|nr:hypothetical protein [bacterium]
MIDTTVVSSHDSLYLSLHDSVTAHDSIFLDLHDSVNVVLCEAPSWTKSDIISLISAVAVVLAVFAAFVVPWFERRIRVKDENEKSIQEYIS